MGEGEGCYRGWRVGKTHITNPIPTIKNMATSQQMYRTGGVRVGNVKTADNGRRGRGNERREGGRRDIYGVC